MNSTALPIEDASEDIYMLVSLIRIAVAGVAVGCLLYTCGSIGYSALIKRLSPKVAPAYVAVPPADEKSSAV